MSARNRPEGELSEIYKNVTGGLPDKVRADIANRLSVLKLSRVDNPPCHHEFASGFPSRMTGVLHSVSKSSRLVVTSLKVLSNPWVDWTNKNRDVRQDPCCELSI